MSEALVANLQIGDLQPEVSCIGFGTYHLGDKLNASDALDAFGAAHQAGIVLFDTSDNYGTELVIGRAVSAGVLPRDEVIIATKTGLGTTMGEQKAWTAAERRQNTDPDRVRKQVDNSLRVLGDDVGPIDIYQLHVHDPLVPPEAHAELMTELIEAGKIRSWGVSNYSIDELGELLEACDSCGLVRPVTSQPFYNMLSLDGQANVDFARDEGLVVLGHSPLVKSALTDARLTQLLGFIEERNREGNHEEKEAIDIMRPTMERMQAIAEVAAEHGRPLAQLAIAWTLREPGVITLTTPTNPSYLEDALAATRWHLDPELLAQIDEMRADTESLNVFRGVVHNLVRDFRGY